MKSAIWAGVFLLSVSTPLLADTIAIIGTGNVARALGPEFAAQGHTIVYGSRQPNSEKARELVAQTPGNASAVLPPESVMGADMVVLAVPGMLVEGITLQLGDLSGKIIVDPTNPLIGDWSKEISLGVETSNAEIIQAAAPEAMVVKAFSTLAWQQMIEPNGAISIPLAGNSDAAKQRVAELVAGMGLEPIDLGDAGSARWIEGMTVLWINNRIAGRPGFEFHLRPVEAGSL